MYIRNKRFFGGPVDLSAYAGDVVIEGCNLTQLQPDTPPGSVFINAGNVTSLTVRNCAAKNIADGGGVVYENSLRTNIGDLTAVKRVNRSLLVQYESTRAVRKVWRWIVATIRDNPTITYGALSTQFGVENPASIIHFDNFAAKLQAWLKEHYPQISTYADFRTWVASNADAVDIERVV
jgi:hypothetical protein